MLYAKEAYGLTGDEDYKDFALFLGDYLLALQDTDGGIRFGPHGMTYDGNSNFYWNLKSTEQNERSLMAFEALYDMTRDADYRRAAENVEAWLKTMYDESFHLYRTAATYDGKLVDSAGCR